MHINIRSVDVENTAIIQLITHCAYSKGISGDFECKKKLKRRSKSIQFIKIG